MPITVRPLTPADDLAGWLREHSGADAVAVHGRLYGAAELDGLVAEREGLRGGVLTWRIDGDTMEIATLDASQRREGIGSRLVAEAVDVARASGLRRLVLTTTNDNCSALIFWQRLGFRLVALHPGSVDALRVLKPSIPEFGENGVPIRDEIDLELLLE